MRRLTTVGGCSACEVVALLVFRLLRSPAQCFLHPTSLYSVSQPQEWLSACGVAACPGPWQRLLSHPEASSHLTSQLPSPLSNLSFPRLCRYFRPLANPVNSIASASHPALLLSAVRLPVTVETDRSHCPCQHCPLLERRIAELLTSYTRPLPLNRLLFLTSI